VEGPDGGENGVLITRYLDGSLPYRTLFMNQGLERYRDRLLDAMAGLLVRLHLAGFYWETAPSPTRSSAATQGSCRLTWWTPRLRAAREALRWTARDGPRHPRGERGGDLADLQIVVQLPPAVSAEETGAQIRRRYDRLWNEINRQLLILPSESYLIQERIRALNELGFSVGEFELVKSGDGDRLRLRTIVVDRDYHRRLLHGLTGLVAGDRQRPCWSTTSRSCRRSCRRSSTAASA